MVRSARKYLEFLVAEVGLVVDHVSDDLVPVGCEEGQRFRNARVVQCWIGSPQPGQIALELAMGEHYYPDGDAGAVDPRLPAQRAGRPDDPGEAGIPRDCLHSSPSRWTALHGAIADIMPPLLGSAAGCRSRPPP